MSLEEDDELFGAETIPLDEMVTELEREYKARLHVYPRLIDTRRLNLGTARRRMRVLRAAIDFLKYGERNHERDKKGESPSPPTE